MSLKRKPLTSYKDKRVNPIMRLFVFTPERFRGTDIDGVGVIIGVGIDVGVGGGVGVDNKVILPFPAGFKLAISEARTFGIRIPIISIITNVILLIWS
jgi:hypothetical protein